MGLGRMRRFIKEIDEWYREIKKVLISKESLEFLCTGRPAERTNVKGKFKREREG